MISGKSGIGSGIDALTAVNDMHEYFAGCAANAKGEARKKFLHWMDTLALVAKRGLDGIDKAVSETPYMDMDYVAGKKTIYRYGTLFRPAGPGAVPRDGLYAIEDWTVLPNGRRVWSVVDYDRQLTDEEIRQYELVFMHCVEVNWNV